jgi:hypothetical protein
MNKYRIIALQEDNTITNFGFQGKYRTQKEGGVSWNWGGIELFTRIPCSNCQKKLSEKELKNGNYNLWTSDNFSWIDKKFACYWNRHLIKYQVPDKEQNCRQFKDGKQLVLKLAFIIIDITHKECNNQ